MDLDLKKSYFLLLIDLKNSTKIDIKKKEIVFNRINTLLTELNATLIPSPILELSISYGDEIAGLFSSPAGFYSVIHRLRTIFDKKTGFRFIVCSGKIGNVSTDIRQIGGEIFKLGEHLMNQLKKDGYFCNWFFNDQDLNMVLNSLTRLSYYLYKNMTDYQRKILELKEQNFLQKDIADKLSKSDDSVSKAIKRSGIELVIQADRSIENILQKTTFHSGSGF